MGKHPLRREIIATMASNEIVGSQGISFVSELLARTGATTSGIVRAYRTARDITGAIERRDAIEATTGIAEPDAWMAVMNANDRTMSSLTRWFLRHRGMRGQEEIARWSKAYTALEEASPSLGPPKWQSERANESKRLETAGFPPDLAIRLSQLPDMTHAPGIISVAGSSGRPVSVIGKVFFRVGQAVQLDSLERILAGMTASDPWNRWARQTIEDDLVELRQLLAEKVLEEGGTKAADDAVDSFLNRRAHALKRVLGFTHALESGSERDLTFFMVVVRQVEGLAAPIG